MTRNDATAMNHLCQWIAGPGAAEINYHGLQPQSRLGPAPEPLPSRASLRTGKLDSCRLLSIRPLTHASPHAAAPLVDATPPPGGRSLRDRQRVAVAEPPQSRVDGNRVAREPPDHFSTRLRRPGGLGGPGCLVLALKAQRGVPERSSNQPKPGTHQAHSCRFI